MRNTISWLLRLIAAALMLQTLYFKFTGQPESIDIFTRLGMEPWGRYGTGIAELVASILLILPSTIVIGAVIAIGLMLGALASHVFVLGIEVQGDGGQLFFYAVIVLIAGLSLLFIHSTQLLDYKRKFIG